VFLAKNKLQEVHSVALKFKPKCQTALIKPQYYRSLTKKVVLGFSYPLTLFKWLLAICVVCVCNEILYDLILNNF